MRFMGIVASGLLPLRDMAIVLARLNFSFSHPSKVISCLNLVHQTYKIFVTFICQLLELDLVLLQPGDLLTSLRTLISMQSPFQRRCSRWVS